MGITLLEFIQGFSLLAAIFLFAGIILLVVEMFIPGFGVAGIGGIVCLIIAIILRANTFVEALWMAIILLAVVGVLLLLFMRSATKGVVSRSPIVLKETIDQNAVDSAADMGCLVGKTGVTLTALRPSGTADFDGVRLDVLTEGDYVPENTQVIIKTIEGRRIVVGLPPAAVGERPQNMNNPRMHKQ